MWAIPFPFPRLRSAARSFGGQARSFGMSMKNSRFISGYGCVFALLLFAVRLAAQEQLVDSGFQTAARSPAYAGLGPVVAIDEAHFNFHTVSGGYSPLAGLLRSDGYRVVASSSAFQPGVFDGIEVLIVANALPKDVDDPELQAFTEEECAAVENWVRSGGSLLLIADHAPFGAAASNLARRFGIEMGEGYVFDTAGVDGAASNLSFSRENGLLGMHPILSGRDTSEEVRSVQAFTGQSLSVPGAAAALLRFSASAREAPGREELRAEDAAARNPDERASYGSRSTPVAGLAQGIAMRFGKGRVVALGEASQLTAQLIRFPDGREMKFGMNVPGNDNERFALNVLHWLSGLLDR